MDVKNGDTRILERTKQPSVHADVAKMITYQSLANEFENSAQTLRMPVEQLIRLAKLLLHNDT